MVDALSIPTEGDCVDTLERGGRTYRLLSPEDVIRPGDYWLWGNGSLVSVFGTFTGIGGAAYREVLNDGV